MPGTRRLLGRTFYFDYDRSVISADDLAVLGMHATFLRDNPDRSVVVEGHCDERGTREYNLALGERRSDAVRRFLTSAGVSPRQNNRSLITIFRLVSVSTRCWSYANNLIAAPTPKGLRSMTSSFVPPRLH